VAPAVALSLTRMLTRTHIRTHARTLRRTHRNNWWKERFVESLGVAVSHTGFADTALVAAVSVRVCVRV